MSAVSGIFKGLAARFDGLTLRERLILFLAVLVLLYVGWEQFLWKPMLAGQDRLKAQVTEIGTRTKLLDATLQGMLFRAQQDPDQKTRQEIERARQQLAQLEGNIKRLADSLIEPRQMARLLETLLTSNRSLRLVNLSTLKTEPLVTAGEGEEQAQKPSKEASPINLYRHGFVIEFEGDYLSALDYLRTLEALPWKFFWDGVTLEVVEHPRSLFRLQLHTLSIAEGWIGV